MATIYPTPNKVASGVNTHTWETLTENDTAAAALIGGLGPLSASVQFVGTFGGATVVLQGSNDGTNWVTIQDLEGNNVSFTAVGAADFSTAMVYLRPSATSGTSQDVDVIVSTRY